MPKNRGRAVWAVLPFLFIPLWMGAQPGVGDCSRITRFSTGSGETRFCRGETIQLVLDLERSSGSQVIRYRWFRNGQRIATTSGNTFQINDAKIGDSGSWRVDAQVFCPDLSIDLLSSPSIDIEVLPAPNANILADPSPVLNCERTEATLRVADAGPGASYSWTGPGLSSTDREVRVTRGGTYLVEVREGECADQDFIEITDHQNIVPNASAGPDIVLQQCGQEITLDASASSNGGRGNLQYQWSGPGYSQSTNNATVRVSDPAPGAYQLTVLNLFSRCTDEDGLRVDGSNLTLPDADAGEEQTITCRDRSLEIGGASAQGPDIAYAWRALDGGNIVEGQNQARARVDQPGRYELTVRNTSTRCAQSDAVVIGANLAAPTVAISPGGNPFFCSGDSLRLRAVGDADSWAWSTGDTDTVLVVNAPDLYLLEGTREENGCVGTAEVNIDERPKPELSPGDTTLNGPAGQTVQVPLRAQPTSARVQWTVEGTANLDDGQSTYEPAGTGRPSGLFVPASDRAPAGVAYLAFARRNGCSSDTSLIQLRLLPEAEALFIPEVFTPNGDGVNDEWIITLPPGEMPDAYRLTLFDRQGRVLLQRNDLSQPWDGNGYPDGIYYYNIVRKADGRSTRGAVALVGKR